MRISNLFSEFQTYVFTYANLFIELVKLESLYGTIIAVLIRALQSVGAKHPPTKSEFSFSISAQLISSVLFGITSPCNVSGYSSHNTKLSSDSFSPSNSSSDLTSGSVSGSEWLSYPITSGITIGFRSIDSCLFILFRSSLWSFS